MTLDLPFIWAGLIAFAVLAYVTLDGFDLGIGILFPFGGNEASRNLMMNSVAPVWDGNETWLVFGGGGLLAVFPLAYAIIMPALYAPLIAMLIGLVLRGVAFEFRWRTRRGRFLWDAAFFAGSLVAALAQGLALGALVQGIKVSGRAYAGGWWDWLTPFSLMTAVALVVGYVLLGATWLNMKTTGEVQDRARRVAMPAGIALLVLIGIISLWTPFLHGYYYHKWLAFPAILYTAPVPLLVALAAYVLVESLAEQRDHLPFLAALALFVLSYIGLSISFYPYIVPGAVTIAAAAAPAKSLAFLLYGAVVLLPVILGYTIWSYWIFGGKLDPEAGYH
ncbi:MAG: cytochrome d ubiquinol oxidase subunit II [Hyphomicrobiales bacterium]|nr:cytochrome d ubiquinol oxidase subunit II [Hyphomicrobiales bacterium]